LESGSRREEERDCQGSGGVLFHRKAVGRGVVLGKMDHGRDGAAEKWLRPPSWGSPDQPTGQARPSRAWRTAEAVPRTKPETLAFAAPGRPTNPGGALMGGIHADGQRRRAIRAQQYDRETVVRGRDRAWVGSWCRRILATLDPVDQGSS